MNKLTAPLLLVALMSGCATMKMDIQDLNTFQIDCANKDAQIRFLESQLSTPNSRLASAFSFDRSQRAAVNNREYDAVAKTLIWQLKTQCPSDIQLWRASK